MQKIAASSGTERICLIGAALQIGQTVPGAWRTGSRSIKCDADYKSSPREVQNQTTYAPSSSRAS